LHENLSPSVVIHFLELYSENNMDG